MIHLHRRRIDLLMRKIGELRAMTRPQ